MYVYVYIYDVYICLYRYLVRVVENTCLHLWTSSRRSKEASRARETLNFGAMHVCGFTVWVYESAYRKCICKCTSHGLKL